MGAKQASYVSEPKTTLEQDQESKEINEWYERSKAIRIMVTGKTGAGKSTLLNGIVGDTMFKEGNELDPETSEVSSHKIQKAGIDIEVFDTPGLQDGSGREQEYIAEMKQKCTNIHLLLYCIKMDETRTDLGRHNSAIKLITRALGHEVWENAVLVLTFANAYEGILDDAKKNDREVKTKFKAKINEWEQAARNSLRAAGVSQEIAENVIAIPAGIARKPDLICQKYWLSYFWTESLFKMKEEAQCAMVKISISRFKYQEDIQPGDFEKDISEQPIVITKLGKSMAGGLTSASAAVGATTGALIGAFAFGVPSFGVAAGVGLVVGGVIGGGIGGGSGVGLGLLTALYRRNKKKQKLIKLKREALEKLGQDFAS